MRGREWGKVDGWMVPVFDALPATNANKKCVKNLDKYYFLKIAYGLTGIQRFIKSIYRACSARAWE
jgi:hypothetical protein